MEIDGVSKSFQKSDEQSKLLATLQDFASIAKTGKLSILFLESFAEVVKLKENTSNSWKVLKSLDVLIAMLDKVKLNKVN